MFKRNYYCLIAGLPDLTINDKKLSFTSLDFREQMMDELHEDDKKVIQLLFLPFDHLNIVKAFKNKEKQTQSRTIDNHQLISNNEIPLFDKRGLFDQEMIALLIDKKEIENRALEIFPQYIRDIFAELHETDETITDINLMIKLQTAYYQLLESHSLPFINKYGACDRNMRNVMAALNGRKFNLPFEQSLIGEGEAVEALKKNKSRDFGLSSIIDKIDQWIHLFEISHPVDRELALDNLRWNFMDEAVFFNYFSIERVFAFVSKLMIIERWLALDEQRGREFFNKLQKEVQAGFELPEEYNLRHGK